MIRYVAFTKPCPTNVYQDDLVNYIFSFKHS